MIAEASRRRAWPCAETTLILLERRDAPMRMRWQLPYGAGPVGGDRAAHGTRRPRRGREVVELVAAEGVAEVGAADGRVVDDLPRRALGEHPPVVDDQGTVADLERLRHVVVGDQHALVKLVAQTLHLDLQVFDGDRVDAAER